MTATYDYRSRLDNELEYQKYADDLGDFLFNATWSRASFSASIYAICLPLLGVSIWRTVLLAALAYIFHKASYGTRWIERFGFGLIIATLLVWFAIIPPPAGWLGLAKQIVPPGCAMFDGGTDSR
jgi:hypothetical protein